MVAHDRWVIGPTALGFESQKREKSESKHKARSQRRRCKQDEDRVPEERKRPKCEWQKDGRGRGDEMTMMWINETISAAESGHSESLGDA